MIFTLRSSQLLRVYTGILIAFGTLSLYATAQPIIMALSGCLMLLMILHSHERPHCLSIEHHSISNEWLLENNVNGLLRVNLLRSSIVFRYLMILHFENRLLQQKEIVVVCSDQVISQDYYRELRRRVLRV